MKLILIKISISIYSVIPLMKTPMSMGIMLIAQTLVSTMILSKIMVTSWMSMIMFLMFVGGLLILFMYMSSIASNEKFSYNFIILMIPIMIMILPMEEIMNETQIMDNLNSFKSNESMSIMKIYSKKSMNITVFLFMYMYLTMIVITNIIKIFKGPMRSYKN